MSEPWHHCRSSYAIVRPIPPTMTRSSSCVAAPASARASLMKLIAYKPCWASSQLASEYHSYPVRLNASLATGPSCVYFARHQTIFASR